MNKPTVHIVHDRAVAAQQAAIATSIEAMLRMQINSYFAAHGEVLPDAGLYDKLLTRLERPLIAATLRATQGNQIKAAEVLGLNRNTLRKKMRELHIDAKALVTKEAA